MCLISKSIIMDVDQLLSTVKAKMDETLKIYNGKSIDTIVRTGSYKKDVLAESVFSLKYVAEELYKIIVHIKKDDALDKCNELMNEMKSLKDSLPEIIKDTIRSADGIHHDSTLSNLAVNDTEDKERHVIVLQEKNSNAKFDEKSWSNVVKSTLKDELKTIPVNKSLVNKNGQGCLFFPNKDAQTEAKSALEQIFDVTTDSKPRKAIMPKIKVFDLDIEMYNNKEDLRQGIMDKNPEIANMVGNENDLGIILLDTSRNFAILKVSPNIREFMINRGKIFVGMHSVKVRDHFQPLQCYACQKYGHKQGSQDCVHFGKETNNCLYCCGNHFSKDCQVKRDSSKHVCANCSQSNSHEQKNNASHKSTSFKCPFMVREINSLIHRTTGINALEAKKLKITVH